MKTRTINPTPWLQAFHINHGVEVTGGERVLFLSGQTSSAADGSPLHVSDIGAQFRCAWRNIKDALAEAGMAPSNVVRLNMYTTDVDGLMAAGVGLLAEVAADGCVSVGTLLGVTRLYHPDILVELEATAVA
jgi:enamine deaminase RidA (YjgF/YER057c/UK114 family)